MFANPHVRPGISIQNGLYSSLNSIGLPPLPPGIEARQIEDGDPRITEDDQLRIIE